MFNIPEVEVFLVVIPIFPLESVVFVYVFPLKLTLNFLFATALPLDVVNFT